LGVRGWRLASECRTCGGFLLGMGYVPNLGG
jgi:hypothetical protein